MVVFIYAQLTKEGYHPGHPADVVFSTPKIDVFEGDDKGWESG